MTIKDPKGTINLEALGRVLSEETRTVVLVHLRERELVLFDAPLSAIPDDLVSAIRILGAEIRW